MNENEVIEVEAIEAERLIKTGFYDRQLSTKSDKGLIDKPDHGKRN
jgi:hypothetical protein